MWSIAAMMTSPEGDTQSSMNTLQSSELSVRIEAIRGLAEATEPPLESLVKVFCKEPRWLQWKPGDPSVRLEAIGLAGKLLPQQARGLLESFLDCETQAAPDDL